MKLWDRSSIRNGVMGLEGGLLQRELIVSSWLHVGLGQVGP